MPDPSVSAGACGPDASGVPALPLLAPGAVVTRRDDGHLQIGLTPPRALVLPESPTARAALGALTTGTAPDPRLLQPLLARLVDRGLLIDGAALRRNLPGSTAGAHAVAATYAQAGLDAPDRLARRAARPVGIELPEALSRALAEILDPVELVRTLAALHGVSTASGDQTPYAVLVAALGEIDRARVDRLSRADIPHLLLTFTEGVARLGPFVVPGQTACLRCVDAHLGERDPRRALVVQQYVGRPARPDGVPEPLDPAVVLATLAWGLRDVIAYVDGDTPGTWSRSVAIGPAMAQDWTAWTRHPHCGCAWDEAVIAG